MNTLTGKQFNRYSLIRRLGQGSFAQVYLAEHIFLKTLVALKILKVLLSDEEIEVFLNEAQTIARLQHPHIVSIYDCGIEDSIPFLVTAYAPLGSLGQRYKECHLPMDDILRYTSQAAAALQYAHDQRVIHRDVKPDNMLLGPNNELWLGDFNLSLTLPRSRPLSLQEAVGTPYYMAPEQINGKPCPASDQYALGVIVYEWLCGTRPFSGSSYGEIFFQHLSQQPPPLHETVPLIPPTVEAVVLQALAKDPQERFPSVQAFADALKQAYAQDMHLLAGGKGQTPNGNHKQVLADSDKQMLSSSRSEQILINSEQRLERIPKKQRLTRRTVLAAVAGGGGVLVLAAGVAGYFPTLFSSHSQAASNAPPTSSVGGATKAQNTPTRQATRTPQSTPTPTPGTTITTYSGHSQEVKAVAWSPDGNRIASGGLDGTVQVWDAATGKNAVTYGSLAATQGVKNIAWSSDGNYLATGNENSTVRVWIVASGQEVLPQAYTGHTSAVRSVAWQPGGTLIASASQDGTVQVWNGLTGQLVSSYRGHSSSWALSVAWSPDGTQIVSG